MNQVWTDEIASKDDFHFFSELNEGRLWRKYVVSDWFNRFSTEINTSSDCVNVIKTNLNHLLITWTQQHFPNIEFWGIWRDPHDILASLLRNDFYNKWFHGAERELEQTVRACPARFPLTYLDLYSRICSREARAMAYVIAVRTHFFFANLNPDHLLVYELFRMGRDNELAKFTRAYRLGDFQWPNDETADLNVVGASWSPNSSHRAHIPDEDLEFAAMVFAPLYELMETRFSRGIDLYISRREQFK